MHAAAMCTACMGLMRQNLMGRLSGDELGRQQGAASHSRAERAIKAIQCTSQESVHAGCGLCYHRHDQNCTAMIETACTARNMLPPSCSLCRLTSQHMHFDSSLAARASSKTQLAL